MFDVSGIEEYKKKLEALQQGLDRVCRDSIAEMQQRVFRDAVKNTPVGDYKKDNLPEIYKRGNTKTGAKAGDVKVDKYGNPKRSNLKMVSFKTRDGKAVSFKAKSVRIGGTLRKGWRAPAPFRMGEEYVGEVYNSVPYAEYVEYGHRIVNRRKETKGWKKGVFMMTNAVKKVSAHEEQIVEGRLSALIKELGLE